MAKTQPTETQIQVVMSDWLGNLRQKDEGNYTHRGKGGIRTKDARSFSEYLIEDTDSLDELNLLKQGRMAAEQVVNAVVSEPAIVQIGGAASLHGEIDGKHVIALATDYFDDVTLSSREKIDILLGLASHEAAHGAFTDNSLTNEKLNKEKPEFQKLKHNIWNLIEDERIEYLLGDERPGLVGSLGATKGYYFKKLCQQLRKDGKMPTEPLPKLLGALTQAVRYPSEMTRDEVEDCFEELNEIRKILTPYPLTPQAAWDATDRVMDVIRDIARKEAEKQKQQQSQQDAGEDSDSQSQGGSSSRNGQQSDGGKKKSSGAKPTKSEIEKALGDMLSTGEAQKVMDAIEEDLNKGNSQNSADAISSPNGNSTENRYVNEDDSETMGGGAGSGEPSAFVFKPRGNQDSYNRSLTHVRAFVPAMAKALACKGSDSDYQLRGLPSGKLNTNKLASFRMGNVNIFDKRGTVTCTKASVVMLIDESGSMHGGRLHAARDTAVLVNEAIARIPNVNFYCYGYTSGKLNVYSEAGKTSKWALGNTVADSGTPTGDAMRLVGQRVRQITSEPCLMLVLTDGCPDDSRKVIEQDKALRGKNFIPIGIGIQSNAVENTFQESVVMMDISTLAFELGKLTRGKLDRLMVRRESE